MLKFILLMKKFKIIDIDFQFQYNVKNFKGAGYEKQRTKNDSVF